MKIHGIHEIIHKYPYLFMNDSWRAYAPRNEHELWWKFHLIHWQTLNSTSSVLHHGRTRFLSTWDWSISTTTCEKPLPRKKNASRIQKRLWHMFCFWKKHSTRSATPTLLWAKLNLYSSIFPPTVMFPSTVAAIGKSRENSSSCAYIHSIGG